MATIHDIAYVRKVEEPFLPPPRGTVGLIERVYASLFSSFPNMILTVIGLAIIVLTVPAVVRWAFIDAVWTGDSREACVAPEAGACWAFVRAKFAQFMYGRYPIEERWRVDLTGILLIAGLVPMAIPRVPFKRENAIYLLGVFPLIALILLTGGNFNISGRAYWYLAVIGGFVTGLASIVAPGAERQPAMRGAAAAAGSIGVLLLIASFFLPSTQPIVAGLSVVELVIAVLAVIAFAAGATLMIQPEGGIRWRLLGLWIAVGIAAAMLLVLGGDFGLAWVETPLWGGLLITLVVAIVGIVGSMPIGILLALGRRSKLPVIRFLSIAFIEFVRGVPLITVLFMASVMLPLFLPPGITFDKLLRALIGVTLFSGAYMAEVVRGGLQAIPRGQYEAANALGMGYWTSMRLIILPQALKIVIPGIVNSFISLFKDTSLVLIIGIFDLLGIVQFNFADSNWAAPNTPATGYVFAATVFWLFCFGMSRYSIYTERRLDTGYRR
jgi:general L-amino acid transport system permease protein